MTKFLEQSKKQEPLVLDMARQALGRIKELELTPEQKKEVMLMIEEAKALEKNKELPKALNAYNDLVIFLKKIEADNEKVTYGKHEIFRSQVKVLEEVENMLMAIDSKLSASELREKIAEGYIVVKDGNIIKLYLNSFHLGRLPDLSPLKNIEKIDCTNCDLTTVPDLTPFKKLKQFSAGLNYFSQKEMDKIVSQLPPDCWHDFLNNHYRA